MISEPSSYDKLIHEFANINVEIEIGSQNFAYPKYGQSIEDETTEYTLTHEFYVKFQNEDKVYYSDYSKTYIEYRTCLNVLSLNFYSDINQEIINFNNKLHILNLLSNYQIRFSELRDDYYEYKSFLPVGTVKVMGNRMINFHYSDDKPILDYCKERIIDKYLIIQVETIEKILRYLEEKINLIKIHIDNEKVDAITRVKNISLGKRIYLMKSFELNPLFFQSDIIIADKLKDFKEALLKGGYIKPIDFRDFIRVFKNQDIKNPIKWVADPKELFYLINTLYEKELIIQFKNYWQITCKCFIAYQKNHTLCSSRYMSRCKPPTRGDQLRSLNSVIDTLK